MMNIKLHLKSPWYVISILYYIFWFLCIGLAAKAWPVSAMLSHFTFAVFVLMNIPYTLRRYVLSYAVIIMLIGTLIDYSLWYFNIIHFPNFTLCWGIFPLWMSSLWFTLATLLLGPFNRILSKTPIAILLGAIGGPFSYIMGAESQAMHIQVSSSDASLYLAIIWGLCMYGGCRVNHHIHGKILDKNLSSEL